MSLSERRLLTREATISAVVAATLAALLLWSVPPGIDWAAHAYQRTFLLHHGFAIWNNFWYAGRYSFITYSLLYYPLAALFGIRILALASITTAAFAFSTVVFRQWGASSRLSGRSFAVLWVGIVGAAAFPFALGISFALLSIWALQEGRRGRFAVGAALALAASPLSFAFLVVVLAGVVLARRSVRDSRVQIAAVCTCATAELVLLRLFGGGGEFPYGTWQLLPSLFFGALGLVVTRGVPAAKSLRGLFWIYLVVCIVAYLVPTSVGSNLERIRYLALPLALMIAALRSWRPLWLLVPTLALAATWNITPIWTSFARASTDPEASQAYWQPAITYLEHNSGVSYRVEVVDTAEHWAAAYFPDAGIPIVRGWYRQSDFPQNEVLYDATLGARAYDAWLRHMAVRFVVVADAPVDYSSRKEAALVRSGRSGLVLAKRFRHVSIYELPRATPLVTGPAHPAVVGLQSQRLIVALGARGTYRVRIRWSPFWRTSSGCVSRTTDGMTQLTVADPGFVDLSFGVNVKRSLETLAGTNPAMACAAGTHAQQ